MNDGFFGCRGVLIACLVSLAFWMALILALMAYIDGRVL